MLSVKGTKHGRLCGSDDAITVGKLLLCLYLAKLASFDLWKTLQGSGSERANFSQDPLDARGASEGASECGRSNSCLIEVKTVLCQPWDGIEVEIKGKEDPANQEQNV